MSELDNSSTIRMPPRFLRNLIRFPLGAYLAIVLCGVLVGGSWFSYTGQLDFTQWNAVLFLIALLLVELIEHGVEFFGEPLLLSDLFSLLLLDRIVVRNVANERLE